MLNTFLFATFLLTSAGRVVVAQEQDESVTIQVDALYDRDDDSEPDLEPDLETEETKVYVEGGQPHRNFYTYRRAWEVNYQAYRGPKWDDNVQSPNIATEDSRYNRINRAIQAISENPAEQVTTTTTPTTVQANQEDWNDMPIYVQHAEGSDECHNATEIETPILDDISSSSSQLIVTPKTTTMGVAIAIAACVGIL